MSWLAGCVAKAQLNAIYMPCDAKAWTTEAQRQIKKWLRKD